MMTITVKEIFEDIKIGKGRVSKNNVIINEPFRYEHNTHAVHIELTNSNFNDIVYLNLKRRSHFEINFTKSIFEEKVTIYIGEEALLNLDISDAQFNNGLELQSKGSNTNIVAKRSKSNGEMQFDNSTLNDICFDEFQFIGNSLFNKFSFNNCSVEKSSSFYNAYLANASFKKTVFHEHANFDYTKFEECNFFETKFRKDLHFKSAEFGTYASFISTNFQGNLILVKCNEKSNKCIADFSGSKFYDNVFFNLASFHKIIFKNCNFNDPSSFRDSQFREVKFERCFFAKGADFENTRYLKGDKETFRTIRSELLRINNKFDSLYYHSKELHFYEKELTYRKNFGEKFMLWLNRISSDHGLRWIRGLCFTSLTAITFFILYITVLPSKPFEFGWLSFDSFIKASNVTTRYFFQFFFITHDIDFMKEYSPNLFNFIIDFSSRIFIGYGIYQTVQAFRKYGKLI